MTKRVVPGESILPHMTARWFNQTLDKPTIPPPPRKKDNRPHNETVATFVPSDLCTKAQRFTAVAPIGRVDGVGDAVQRAQYVNKESLTKLNWIVTQLEMGEGYRTQACVYAGITFAKVNIRDPQHGFVDLNLNTLELESSNVGKAILLDVGSPYSMISIETYPDVPPTPATTTPADCAGTCRFEESDGTWVQTDNNCNPTTTTTTTTSTSPDGTTTTYHDQDCRAATTTPLQEGDCECVPPDFCPDEAGVCITLACSKNVNAEPLCDPTSTTTTSTSTTTTACDCNTTTTSDSVGCSPVNPSGALCSNACRWISTSAGTWYLSSNGCCEDCTCFPPAGPVPECGAVRLTACVCPPPIIRDCKPTICSGGNTFSCIGDISIPGSGFWVRLSTNSCFSNCIAETYPPNCSCVETDIPTGPCEPCDVGYSKCNVRCGPATTTPLCDTFAPYIPDYSACAYCYGGSSTTTSSSTTTPACTDECRMRYVESVWTNIADTCASPCECLTPPSPPEEACNVIVTPCIQTTTTSTTTTTTTSTTTTEEPTTTSTTTTTTSTTTTTTTTSTTTTCDPNCAESCIGDDVVFARCIDNTWVVCCETCLDGPPELTGSPDCVPGEGCPAVSGPFACPTPTTTT